MKWGNWRQAKTKNWQNVIICCPWQTILDRLNKKIWDTRVIWHVWGTGEMRKACRWGKLKKTGLFEEQSLTRKDKIAIYLTGTGWDSMDWIHLPRARDKWRALVNIRWIFGFHKVRWISWIGEQPTSSHKELSSMESPGEILQSLINCL